MSNTVRVNQLWPSDLKEEIQTLVGKRRMTEFTIQAVREKAARDKEQPEAEPERSAEQAAVQEVHDAAVQNLADLQDVEDAMDAEDAENAKESASQGYDTSTPDEAQALDVRSVELPPVAVSPIPVTVVDLDVMSPVVAQVIKTCPNCQTELDNGYCWLCGGP